MKKSQIPQKILLPESEIPKYWYNIQADMKELPDPYLSPATKKPLTADELSAIFPKALIEQEMTRERYIEIPEDVRKKYKFGRVTPLYRAYGLEKYLDTPARIYYKYEGANPSGSHKLNSAIPQAYYNKEAGIKRLTTETGAGQWGTALSIAAQAYGIDLTVYMVKVSFNQKPYRKSIMEVYGANVIASPSDTTNAGREILKKYPDTNGSLGMAISEAVEVAATNSDTNYALGSVLNHVILHQTVIGEEALKQFELIDEYPDIVIGCNGGGSNFGGSAFPFLKDKLNGKTKTRFIAVEPSACPKLTKGVYTYDFSDSAQMTPISKMYTLGHQFMPSGIHAGGLRFHGDSPLLSKLYHDGYVEASAVSQQEVFEAAVAFARNEIIVPAPESSHAICEVIKQALICKETGEEKVIFFNLSGHGYLDLAAYSSFLSGELSNDIPNLEAAIKESLDNLPNV